MISSTYNNNVQIVQTRDYVMLQTEMIHEARIVPLDGRPHGTLPRWTGDSRGRWEGDTLVVETINFKRETSLPGSSAKTRLVERFTRVGPDTIKYQFTVTDPTTLHAAVDGGDAAHEDRRVDLRVRVPRGELRHDRHPLRRALPGERAGREEVGRRREPRWLSAEAIPERIGRTAATRPRRATLLRSASAYEAETRPGVPDADRRRGPGP